MVLCKVSNEILMVHFSEIPLRMGRAALAYIFLVRSEHIYILRILLPIWKCCHKGWSVSKTLFEKTLLLRSDLYCLGLW